MAFRYKVGGHKFGSRKEYQAALRDTEKICSLKTEGSSLTEIYDSYLGQIAEKGITFETVIGRDFLKTVTEKRERPGPDLKPEADIAQNVKTYYIVSKKKQKLKWFLMTTFTLLFILCIAILCGWYYENYRSSKSIEAMRDIIKEEKPDAMVAVEASDIQGASSERDDTVETISSVDISGQMINKPMLPKFAKLYEQNEDLAGWLTIPDTKIDYPVMYRADDNDYYLSHDFEGNTDVNGLLILDKRCDPKLYEMNYLIHGHNMRSGAMFGSIKNYTKESYYKKHPLIEFSTLYEEMTFQIFAVFKSSVYDETTDDFRFYDYIRIDNEEQFDDYVSGVKEQSLYDTGITPVYGDILITLSTCDYSRENGRLLIVGKCADEKE
ncbi:MAG: class B sortase [Lachnospiraceae bacterium]|nr:class B sortase [Lachnospiraceae bacterium]